LNGHFSIELGNSNFDVVGNGELISFNGGGIVKIKFNNFNINLMGNFNSVLFDGSFILKVEIDD